MNPFTVFPDEPFAYSEFESLGPELEISRLPSGAGRRSPDYVRWVQNALNKVMALRLAVDGILGPATRSAIRSFQQKVELAADGIVGPETEEAIRAALATQSIEQPPRLVRETFRFPDKPKIQDRLGTRRNVHDSLEVREFEFLEGSEKYSYAGGYFIGRGYLQWEEWQHNSLSYRFVEARRADGYIYLYDISRNIWVAIPINGGRSYYAYGGGSAWTDLYDVMKDKKSLDFRSRAIKLLEPLPPYPLEITSNGPKRHIFTQMTGLTHERLVADWATDACRSRRQCLTSCNGFTGWFASAMGSKTYLGRFDLETVAKRSWVPASSGLMPKYGDILRFQTLHVGVALDVVNGVLNTAEGGQGGPKRGFDAIKRKQIVWDPSKFRGWVDLEAWILGG